ncbi:MAG: hypothetical protein AB7P31_12495 [Steroidobacteraceae bacterium]
MAQHVWSILCREPLIDRQTNSLSLVGVLEEVQVEFAYPKGSEPPELPVTAMPIHVVSYWVRDPREKGVVERLRARILSPSRKQIGTIEHQFSMVDHVRARNVLTARALRLASAGRYTVEIQQPAGKEKWRTVARLPLDVTISTREHDSESSRS